MALSMFQVRGGAQGRVSSSLTALPATDLTASWMGASLLLALFTAACEAKCYVSRYCAHLMVRLVCNGLKTSWRQLGVAAIQPHTLPHCSLCVQFAHSYIPREQHRPKEQHLHVISRMKD